MSYLLKYCTLGISVFVAILAFKKYRYQRDNNKVSKFKFPIDTANFIEIELPTLTLENVILWFKEQLDPDKINSQAILIKITNKNQVAHEMLADFENLDQILFVQGFYDKEAKKLFNSRFVFCNDIDEDLRYQLGDEDMIVFE